jgi:hypothetical protein
MMPDTALNEIVRQLQLSSEHWTVEVTPPPSLEAPGARSLRDRLAETLQSLGVVPGSTLHFRRAQPRLWIKGVVTLYAGGWYRKIWHFPRYLRRIFHGI